MCENSQSGDEPSLFEVIEIWRALANPQEGGFKVMASLHNRLFLAGAVLDIFRPVFGLYPLARG
jgi:hypothetical protein